MKTLRFIGMALLAMVLSVSFTACSDNGDKDEITSNSFLIGVWIESWYDDIIELKADRSGYYAEFLDDTEVASFHWTYKDGMLTYVMADGEIEEARLVNQSEDKILWKHYVNYPDAYNSNVIKKDDYGYYYMWTWERYTK